MRSINGIDVDAGRNAFTAPPFVNLDMRFTKRFDITGRVKGGRAARILQRAEPPEPGRRRDAERVCTIEPFGQAIQVLPGREGQIGFRIEF